MTRELQFTLRIPRSRESGLFMTSTTSYRFHGLLRFEEGSLHLEWAGTAHHRTSALFFRRSRTVGFPPETLIIPIGALRAATLRTGWLRSYLELRGRDLATLATIPGEDRGSARLWIARASRPAAAELVSAIANTP